MSIEHGSSLFTESERNNENNCVFFAALDYVADQFNVEMTRSDFSRFLTRKKSIAAGSGIALAQIASTLDHLLDPHKTKVSSILFQIGLKKHYQNQNTLKNPREWLVIQRFLKDRRIVKAEYWDFPFLVWLTGDTEIDHLEYIANLDNFNTALEKVEGDKGRMPLGFRLEQIGL